MRGLEKESERKEFAAVITAAIMASIPSEENLLRAARWPRPVTFLLVVIESSLFRLITYVLNLFIQGRIPRNCQQENR